MRTPAVVYEDFYAPQACIIYVPVGCKDAYNVVPWNKYKIVEGLPTGISEVIVDGAAGSAASVYDMGGNLRGTVKDFDRLPKGIYVTGGSKVMKP